MESSPATTHNLDVLQRLNASLQQELQRHHKGRYYKGVCITRIGQHFDVQRPAGIFQKVQIGAKKQRVSRENRLKELRNFLIRIRDEAAVSSEAYREPMIETAVCLKALYANLSKQTGAAALLQRNDIAEGLSVFYGNDLNPAFSSLNQTIGLNVERLTTAEIGRDLSSEAAQTARPFSQYDVPLVDIRHVSSALSTLRDFDGPGERAVALLAQREKVPAGRLIDLMYQHRIGKSRRLVKLATQVISKIKLRPCSTRGIAKFLNSINVIPEACLNGRVYAYHEFYERDLRAESSQDDAFGRRMNPRAEAAHLDAYRALQSQIERAPGTGGATAQVCNSYCRLTHHELPAGSTATKFNITGKVLDQSPSTHQAARRERGPQGKFQFSIQNMFGFADGYQMAITESVQPRSRQHAHRLYLQCLNNMVNRENTYMVIQRLAPEDYHHYCASGSGTVLGPAEAALELQARLNAMGDTPSVEAERRQLEQLAAYLNNEYGAEHSPSTINIEGTQHSVSRKALFSHSSILAENDRKIMLVRHPEGSLAVHTFIGATAVNRVGVTTEAGMSYGPEDNIGAMRHGDESRAVKSSWLPGSSRPSVSVTAASGAHVSAGTEVGEVPFGGSTVVSLYFKSDHRPVSALDEASRVLKTTVNVIRLRDRILSALLRILFPFNKRRTPHRLEQRHIELRSYMGTPLMVPTTYAIHGALTAFLGEHYRHLTTDELLNTLISTPGDLSAHPARMDQANLNLVLSDLRALAGKSANAYTISEKRLLKALNRVLDDGNKN